MLVFIGIFATGVAALLLVQHLDIECVGPRKPAKIAQPKTASRPNFDGALTQS
jgi:hypothetical protein